MANKTAENTVRVRLWAYDVKLLDSTVLLILDAVKRSGSNVVGPIMLPVRIRKWAVNKSPHVYTSSMEHFEIRIHKRLLIIENPTPKTVETLQGLQIPAGVSVKLG